MVHFSFYIYDIIEFDLLIGQPIRRLIQEGQTGKLKISLGKNFKLSIPITDDLIEPSLEDDVQFFIEEEDENPTEPEPLDELLKPPKPTIELKPLPSDLRYAFLNNNQDSPMIIIDKLSQKETLHLLTVSEKHRSTFGYSLQYLKGISPALCTHRIPTDPDSIPSREP
jgi:hypothetical protein